MMISLPHTHPYCRPTRRESVTSGIGNRLIDYLAGKRLSQRTSVAEYIERYIHRRLFKHAATCIILQLLSQGVHSAIIEAASPQPQTLLTLVFIVWIVSRNYVILFH